MRVLVTGDREWNDVEKVVEALSSRLTSADTLVHGAARGADRISGEVARELGVKVIEVPADWNKYAKAAGPIRNALMLREYGPFDLVFVFHSDLSKSRGTKDMVQRLENAGYGDEKFVYVK